MKYSINLNQKTLTKIAPDLNIIQASILGFCIDFINAKSPKIQRYEIDGEIYTHIAPKLIVREMPLLKINNHKVIRRHITTIEKSGFLKAKLINNNLPVFKLTDKVDYLTFSDLGFDIEIEEVVPKKGVELNSTTPPGTRKCHPPVLSSTPNHNISNHNINNQSKDIEVSNSATTADNLNDDDLNYLFNEISKHKVAYKTSADLLKQIIKVFTEFTPEITKYLRNYWIKQYKLSSGWNTGAWLVTDFLPKAYEAYVRENIKKERIQKNQQDEALHKKNCLEILDDFLNCPLAEQQSVINSYNQQRDHGLELSLDNIYVSKEIYMYESRYDFALYLLHDNRKWQKKSKQDI